MSGRVADVKIPGRADDRLRRYEQAADKARQWLLSRVRADGSFNARHENLRCFLRSPLALLMTGEPGAAYALLGRLESKYLDAEGDFRSTAEAKYGTDSPNMKGEQNFYLYGNGWATISAHLNGRFDISYRALTNILRHQDPWTGGFYSHRAAASSPRERQDLASTSSCCYTLLFCGRISEAVKAADFLVRLVELQQDSNRFYLSCTREGGLVTQFSPTDAPFYVVDQQQLKQSYWMLGYASALLAKVYLASGDRKYLEGATRYFDFLIACQPDAKSAFGFWKMAWAASVLTSILKEEKYMNCAVELLDRIVAGQQNEGYWAWSLDLGLGLEHDDWLIDLSSEMTIWLCELPRMLRLLSTESGPT